MVAKTKVCTHPDCKKRKPIEEFPKYKNGKPWARCRVCKNQARTVLRQKNRERAIWTDMIYRCENKKHVYYKDYGGRGIKVCKRWYTFRLFLLDVGKRPSLKHTLDRINNDGDYKPSNCRWATRKEQQRNSRGNRNITIAGETMCLAAWCEKLKLNPGTIDYRIYTLKWSGKKSLTTPVRVYRRAA